MQTTGYVQFTMTCGDCKSKIITRMFPNLHKECILGMPWLEYENPIIDWTCKQVTIQQPSYILTLLFMHRRQVKPNIEMVNLHNAKQVAQWFRLGKMDEAYLPFILLVGDRKEQEIVLVVSK